MDDFDKELAAQSEQGSKMWVDIRAGRFTSSEMNKLMKSGYRLMTEDELKARPKKGKGATVKYIEDPTCIADETMTYIEEKVAETLTGIAAETPYSYATAYGDEMEPIAAEHFAQKTGCKFEIVAFVPFGEHAGGSPDRFIIGSSEILEIKCPHLSKNQVKYLQLTDQWDLKRLFPEYYWQAMSNLLFTDKSLLHFCTYDPRMKLEKHKMTHIEVKPIAEDFDLIIKKLEGAVKSKLELLQMLNESKYELPKLKF